MSSPRRNMKPIHAALVGAALADPAHSPATLERAVPAATVGLRRGDLVTLIGLLAHGQAGAVRMLEKTGADFDREQYLGDLADPTTAINRIVMGGDSP